MWMRLTSKLFVVLVSSTCNAIIKSNWCDHRINCWRDCHGERHQHNCKRSMMIQHSTIHPLWQSPMHSIQILNSWICELQLIISQTHFGPNRWTKLLLFFLLLSALMKRSLLKFCHCSSFERNSVSSTTLFVLLVSDALMQKVQAFEWVNMHLLC